MVLSSKKHKDKEQAQTKQGLSSETRDNNPVPVKLSVFETSANARQAHNITTKGSGTNSNHQAIFTKRTSKVRQYKNPKKLNKHPRQMTQNEEMENTTTSISSLPSASHETTLRNKQKLQINHRSNHDSLLSRTSKPTKPSCSYTAEPHGTSSASSIQSPHVRSTAGREQDDLATLVTQLNDNSLLRSFQEDSSMYLYDYEEDAALIDTVQLDEKEKFVCRNGIVDCWIDCLINSEYEAVPKQIGNCYIVPGDLQESYEKFHSEYHSLAINGFLRKPNVLIEKWMEESGVSLERLSLNNTIFYKFSQDQVDSLCGWVEHARTKYT